VSHCPPADLEIAGFFQDFFRNRLRSFRLYSGRKSILDRATTGESKVDVAAAWVISPHASTRQLVGLNLSRRGFKVWEASLPSDLRRSDAESHLIIVDIDPPNGLGWEAASSLREDPALRKVPLIFLTADAPTSGRLASLDPARWTSKPVDVRVLLEVVQECLSQQSRRYKMTTSQQAFADRVRAIPGGEHLYMCYSCGTCVGSCMLQLTGELGYNPRRLIQKVINGLEQEAFEDRTTWLCSACDLCYPTCPQKIHISDVLRAVKELAIEAEYTSPLKTATVNELTCVACGLCVKVCPYEAVSLVEKQVAGRTHTFASVDADRCMACGLCTASCRSASIKLSGGFSDEVLIEDLWGWMQRTAPASIPRAGVAK
jgi:heterodisulfide reductase subunit C